MKRNITYANCSRKCDQDINFSQIKLKKTSIGLNSENNPKFRQDYIHPNSNSNVASKGQSNDEIAMELNENKSDLNLKIAGKSTKQFVKKVFFIETNLSNPSKPKSVLKSLLNNPKYYKVQAKDAESLQKVEDWLQNKQPKLLPKPEKSQRKSQIHQQSPVLTSIQPLDLRPLKQPPLYTFGQKNLQNLPQPHQTKISKSEEDQPIPMINENEFVFEGDLTCAENYEVSADTKTKSKLLIDDTEAIYDINDNFQVLTRTHGSDLTCDETMDSTLETKSEDPTRTEEAETTIELVDLTDSEISEDTSVEILEDNVNLDLPSKEFLCDFDPPNKDDLEILDSPIKEYLEKLQAESNMNLYQNCVKQMSHEDEFLEAAIYFFQHMNWPSKDDLGDLDPPSKQDLEILYSPSKEYLETLRAESRMNLLKYCIKQMNKDEFLKAAHYFSRHLKNCIENRLKLVENLLMPVIANDNFQAPTEMEVDFNQQNYGNPNEIRQPEGIGIKNGNKGLQPDECDRMSAVEALLALKNMPTLVPGDKSAEANRQ